MSTRLAAEGLRASCGSRCSRAWRFAAHELLKCRISVLSASDVSADQMMTRRHVCHLGPLQSRHDFGNIFNFFVFHSSPQALVTSASRKVGRRPRECRGIRCSQLCTDSAHKPQCRWSSSGEGPPSEGQPLVGIAKETPKPP